MNMSKLPKVVIVGRMNVGKSTLFNRMSVEVKSIMLDYEGVTRDFISDIVCWDGTCFELIDCGGIDLQKTHDILAQKVQKIVFDLIEIADVILFVGDGTVGMVTEDREIGNYLHKLKKTVLVAVNKIDNSKADDQQYEFAQLGFKDVLPISAQHGVGIADLLEAIVRSLPKKIAQVTEDKPSYKIVLLGKPNVGKSSLMNLLVDKERSVVTDIPGTTREAISESLHFYQETITVTDTPGIRKKRAIDEKLEHMMIKTSFRALEHASIVLLLIDGTHASFSDQELKLAFYAFEQGKALIILFNKEDLVTDLQRSDLAFDLEKYEYFINKVPQLTISCKTNKNIGRILPLVKKVWLRYSQWLPAVELNRICKEALERKPLYHSGNMLVLYKAEQVKTGPITIILFVNKPAWFGPSELAFFENILRSHFDLHGVPVLFIPRAKGS